MSNNKVINLATYEAPKAVESKRFEWVEFEMKQPNSNKSIDAYTWLIDRYRYSTTNNAIINNVARLMYGKGLDALDASRKPSEYAQMKSLFSKETLRRIGKDLKMLGMGHFQVIYNKNHTKILRVEHIATNLIRPNKCNEDGEIEGYWYCDDWSDTRNYEPVMYPAFGSSKKEIEIYSIQPFTVGMKYFSDVDYFGALPYCVLEEEIADYLINDAQNGFAPTTIVNYNNGVPSEEQQKAINKTTLEKTTGSKGKKTIVSFNDNAELKTTIDSVPLNDAPQHYEYLSNECRNKILASHGIVSPMLVGIVTDNQGFNSIADEIEVASKYFYNTAVRFLQDLVIDAIDEILAFNNVALDLYFIPVGLLDVQVREKEAPKQELSLSKDKAIVDLLSTFADDDLEGYELIDVSKVDYETEEELDKQIHDLNNQKPSVLSKVLEFVSTGTARPNIKSEQDGAVFKSRYRYMGKVSEDSRDFCKKMIQADKIYRKEDIVRMESTVVNAGWGPEGADVYSIWLYKGGGACGHYWQRETYLKKSDANSPLARKYTPAEVRKAGEIVPLTDKDKNGKAVNDNRVYTKPKDMPYEGFLPTNKRFN